MDKREMDRPTRNIHIQIRMEDSNISLSEFGQTWRQKVSVEIVYAMVTKKY